MDARCTSDRRLTIRPQSSMRSTFALLIALFLLPAMTFAQGGLPRDGNLGNDKAPVGPAPHTPDGNVDLSGVWDPGFSFATLGQVPLQPWAEKIYRERRDTLSKDDPEARCL